MKFSIVPVPPGTSFKDPKIMLATWFGAGLIRPAPGTMGTFAALPLGYLIMALWGQIGLAAATIILLIIGTVSADYYGAKSGVKDDQSIVVDEAVGVWIAALFADTHIALWILAALLFRFFDIWKPWPASLFDNRSRDGFDVMMDDVVAGVYALLGVSVSLSTVTHKGKTMPFFSPQQLALAEQVIRAATAKKLQIATAESCTGGLIAACLTEVTGSSAVFDRGYISYSYDSKTAYLDVPQKVVVACGAVSAEVARGMAEGALRHSKADIAISATGIAGPGGGTPEKPVGLVYLGVALKAKKDSYALKNNFTGDRGAVRLQTVETALNVLKKEIDSL